jgi:monoamine oxidase
MIGRRALLAGALGLGAGVAVGCGRGPAPPPTAGTEPVLVLGAGVAGLAAARELAAAGRAVQLIEGRERIGGRLWTSRTWPDAPMDLGASWIHGTRGNPVTELAQRAGARLRVTDDESAVRYDASGRPLSPAAEAALARIAGSVQDALAAAQQADPDRSVLSAARAGIGWDGLDRRSRQSADFVLATIESEYAGPAAALSAHWFDDDRTFPGDDALLPDGYDAVAGLLAEGLPITTGAVATDVSWNRGGVTVATTAGVFRGAQLVLTLPLGVLQAGSVRFQPALPTTLRRAVGALGSGVLNKVVLRFERAFWDTDVDWIEFVPDLGAPPWTQWLNLAGPTGAPILLAFAAGDLGRQVDRWSDQEVVGSALAAARAMYGPSVPDPTGWQITRWGADPFAAGSYSCNALGSEPGLRDVLAEPVDDRLYLAGEACQRPYFGTVHGAYLSGVRAAGLVLDA